MTPGQNVSLFFKQVVARIKGDGAEVVAAKNTRKADSAFNAQLASLQSKQVDQEAELESAQEGLEEAKYPTDLITDNREYIQGIVDAQQNVDRAQERLDDTKKAITFFTELKAKLFTEEAAS